MFIGSHQAYKHVYTDKVASAYKPLQANILDCWS